MSNHLVWQERFNIGVDLIDKEHRKLFRIINRLFAFSAQEEKTQWVCEEGIKYFKEHAMKHFSEEEVYMASINYREYETHRRLHDNFRVKTLPALERELKQTEYSAEAISHFLGVCAGWLIGHTLTEDHAITGKAMSKWVNLMPEEQQAAMRQTINQLLYDLFRLDAQVISDTYGGEKFGEGIYYRLVYGNKQGENWEVILVFEEKLLVNTVGKLMSCESDRLDVLLVNAARYMSRQFVDCIGEHFPSADLYEMKEETLLSYEQLQKLLERERPQFSFLFDTGEGYFAYCALAPHLLDEKIGTSIKAENAMTEIKKYLEKRETPQKRKILVVDDSSVMLQMMKELLEKDYEVVLAKSGLSAIRSITLNRPDLILLDYEMPVCDGSQVLEMIREEEDFADIPVIFLTGRVDTQSVKKAVSLKPAGYLLKNLRPEEIKKNIDEHFAKRSN